MAVIALALGIGVNTTVFTFVNAVLLRGLPFEEAHRVMHLENIHIEEGNAREVSYPDFEDWREQSSTFRDLAAFTEGTMNLSDGSKLPERYSGAWVTANTFSMIGQKTHVGRDFEAHEDQAAAEPVAILGYSIWRDRYGADPGVLGKSIRINEEPFTVVGVMPEGMRFPVGSDLWLPLKKGERWVGRTNRGLEVFGKLAEGMSLSQAQAEMDGITERLRQAYPETNEAMGVEVKPYNDEYNGGTIRLMFLTLTGAVGFVLLISCANVANMLLSRAASRTREVSVRTALGASRWSVIRQLLVESVMLSFLGGILGLVFSYWGVGAFERAVASVNKPYWIDFSIDWTVFAYLTLICMATGILFGIVPALQTSRADIAETLKESGRSGSKGMLARRFSGFLVMTELALAVVLLVGAGLMIRSFLNLNSMDFGVQSENLLTMRLGLPEAKYPEDDQRVRFHEQLSERMNAIAGIERATVASALPAGGAFRFTYEIEGRPPDDPEDLPTVRCLIVQPGYFEVMGAPLLRGADFGPRDGEEGAAVAIVNRAFADRHWSDSDPMGQRIRIRGGESPWLAIKGIGPDIRQNGPDEVELDPVVYLPYRYNPVRFVNIVARTQGPPAAVSGDLRRAVQAVDPNLPVYNVQTMDEFKSQMSWPFRVFGTLFAVMALIALVLSSMGIYAVMAYAVSQRTQEIGIRMALGAERRGVMRMVLNQAARRLAVGLAVGLAGAFGLSRIMSQFMIRVDTTDPLTFVLISILLSVAALAACLIPAGRASRIDPILALRTE